MTTIITIGDPSHPSVIAMLHDSDKYYANLYPSESNHLLDISDLKKANVIFLIALSKNQILGFGSIVLMSNYAEIKRMYVDPIARGKGIGRKLLQNLELEAKKNGAFFTKLETGVKQLEAIALYQSQGYIEIANFGTYMPDPLSIFMEKKLS